MNLGRFNHRKEGEMLNQLDIYGKNKIEVAVERIRYFEPPDGYYLAFSGGKDSVVCYKLLELAKVKFDTHYNITGIDPPELVQFIKKHYPNVVRHRPPMTMWQLIEKKKMPPTRLVRYCCEALKEGGGIGRFVVTGVRWAESSKRKNARKGVEFDTYGSKSKQAIERREVFLQSDNDEKRRIIETCQIKGKNILNPIIDWTEDEVWEFIHRYELPYCELYDKGYTRLGCIGCPMDPKTQQKEFEEYPAFRRAYLRAFDKMLEARRAAGLPTKWETAEEVMEWWLK